MKRLLILLAATALSAPAFAQHHGHHMPGHAAPKAKPKAQPAPKAAARKPAARKAPVRKAAAKPKPKAAAKAPARKAAPKPAPKAAAAPKPAPGAGPHAGHAMPAAPAGQPAVDPHAGHQMPQTTDPHAGHVMPAAPAGQPAVDPHAGHRMPQAADPHAGHQMPQATDPHAGHQLAAEQPPVAPPPPAAFAGPEHAADLVYGNAAMAQAREEMRKEHGALTAYRILVDQLEARLRGGRDGYAWDAQAWYGGDINKLWLKSEGEGGFGEAPEQAEVQALWSHAIGPWFDLQAGIRYDFRPDPERAYLVLGVQGLAPYWFEVDAAAFVSDKGDVSARAEVEYDLRLTRKLILQPRVEFDLALQDVPELGIGSGLSSAELGARLRYEIRPEFAPYVGLGYERAFGDTAGFRRAAGEKAGGWSLLLGLRTWF